MDRFYRLKRNNFQTCSRDEEPSPFNFRNKSLQNHYVVVLEFDVFKGSIMNVANLLK